MNGFNDVGRLMHLPLSDIKPGEPTTEPEFVINAAADALRQTNGRNWVPLIVKQVDKYTYEVVSHSFIYAVAEQAGLERVWAIVTSPEQQAVELARVLSKESIPKVNLCTASYDTIMAVMRYLIEKPGSSLKSVKLLDAVAKIDQADRSTWKSLEPISKLKCGITKAKLSALEEAFYVSPSQEEPEPPEAISLKKASRDEIFDRLKYLAEFKMAGFNKVDPDTAADAIFTASKGKWKSLNPIASLGIGISKTQIKTLKTVFSL